MAREWALGATDLSKESKCPYQGQFICQLLTAKSKKKKLTHLAVAS